MYSRKDYLSGICTHEEYYGQFVGPSVKALVESRIGRESIFASRDPHFNDIPLRMWDSLHHIITDMCLRTAMELNPDEVTVKDGKRSIAWALVDTGCIAKEAARQIKASSPNTLLDK